MQQWIRLKKNNTIWSVFVIMILLILQAKNQKDFLMSVEAHQNLKCFVQMLAQILDGKWKHFDNIYILQSKLMTSFERQKRITEYQQYPPLSDWAGHMGVSPGALSIYLSSLTSYMNNNTQGGSFRPWHQNLLFLTVLFSYPLQYRDVITPCK